MSESDWDYHVIPGNAAMMKERYDINFGKDIVPDDPDLSDRLFLAGVDMLLTTGIYNTDLGRAMMIDEDEIYEGIKMAPKKLTLGHGKDKCKCKARRGNSNRKPVIQGGPTRRAYTCHLRRQYAKGLAEAHHVETQHRHPRHHRQRCPEHRQRSSGDHQLALGDQGDHGRDKVGP